MVTATREVYVDLRVMHPKQQLIKDSKAKRKIVRAGRRGGKTTYAADEAVERFIHGGRVLYAAPTDEQIDRFWKEVKAALAQPIEEDVYYKNETKHIIELSGTEQRIRGKTAWNADTLRGDYADLLILDEWQLMDETAWTEVGAPMLLDNDGDAIFIYTPPSLHSRSVTKATDPRHAAKMFKRAQEDTTGRWEAFHFSSRDNKYISEVAIDELKYDMTALAIRQEIEALDVDEIPGALWTRELLDRTRVVASPPELTRIVIGVDPPGGSTECGSVAGAIANCGCKGRIEQHLYVLADRSLRASPDGWAGAVLALYHELGADLVVAEKNYGGDMVENTIRQAAKSREIPVNFRNVTATRGKLVRAEPIAAAFEQGRAHIVGQMPLLEEELVSYVPGQSQQSPNRMDAMVWALTSLGKQGSWRPV